MTQLEDMKIFLEWVVNQNRQWKLMEELIGFSEDTEPYDVEAAKLTDYILISVFEMDETIARAMGYDDVIYWLQRKIEKMEEEDQNG